MKRTLLSALFTLSLFLNLQAQNTVGTIEVTNEAYDGYTLFSVNKGTYLINNCGQVINEWTSDYIPGHSVYILPNGDLIRAGRLDTSTIAFGGVGGIIERFNWEGQKIWEYTYSDNQGRAHHDIYPLPNGNILILAATVVSNADAIQAGRDPNLLNGDLYNERIIEVEPTGASGGNIVWEWNVMDHLIQDFDNTKDNFGVVSDHPEKIDINFTNGAPLTPNWLHINSIQYYEPLDQIVISSRYMSEFWIIDHSTTTAEAATGSGGTYGKGGDFLYRWGNPQAYKQGTALDQKLFGQHFPHFIPEGLNNEGKIIVFNNGFGRDPNFSQIDIINPPMTSPGVYSYTANTAYGPENTDFTYSNGTGFYSAILSSGVLLPNGNILIDEGAIGHLFEINASNEIVWEYVLPVNNSLGTVYNQFDTPAGNSTFRAIKYAKDYAGFNGKTVTPNDPIEGNFNLDPCNTLSNNDYDFSTVSLFPNPVRNTLRIQTTETIETVEIYNLLGKKVLESSSIEVNLGSLTNGV